jgi:hypothetical protein
MATVITVPQWAYADVVNLMLAEGMTEADNTEGDGTTSTMTWNTDLPSAQVDRINDMIGATKSGVSIDFYQSLEEEIPILKAYTNQNNPTNAQSVTAIKSIIRVLRAIVRDA